MVIILRSFVSLVSSYLLFLRFCDIVARVTVVCNRSSVSEVVSVPMLSASGLLVLKFSL